MAMKCMESHKVFLCYFGFGDPATYLN